MGILLYIVFHMFFSLILFLACLGLCSNAINVVESVVDDLTKEMDDITEAIFRVSIILTLGPFWGLLLIFAFMTKLLDILKIIFQVRKGFSDLENHKTYRPLPDSLTIQPSEIEGLGLFLVEGKHLPSGCMIGESHRKVGKDLLRTPLGGFINHSETPNCVKVNIGNSVYLRTLKPLEGPVELTLTYNMSKPYEGYEGYEDHERPEYRDVPFKTYKDYRDYRDCMDYRPRHREEYREEYKDYRDYRD